MREVPPVTMAIIVINMLVFLLEPILGNEIIRIFALWPLGSLFYPWQLLTYAFLHGSFIHISFNMLAVYMFGAEVENIWGRRRYLLYYFVCLISAALAQLIVSMNAGLYPTIGASGAVFGLLLAFSVYFPERQLMLLIFPIPLPARIVVVIYGVLELLLGVTGSQQGIAHFAHLGGLAGGFILLRHWKKKPSR